MEEFEPGSPVAVETIGNWYWMLAKKEAYRDPATDRTEVESKKEA